MELKFIDIQTQSAQLNHEKDENQEIDKEEFDFDICNDWRIDKLNDVKMGKCGKNQEKDDKSLTD